MAITGYNNYFNFSFQIGVEKQKSVEFFKETAKLEKPTIKIRC